MGLFNWQKRRQIKPCWILIFGLCFCNFTWLYLINVINMCCRGLNDPFPAPCCLYSLSHCSVSGLTYLSSRRYSQAKFCILNRFFLLPHRNSPKAKPVQQYVQWGKLGYPASCQFKIWGENLEEMLCKLVTCRSSHCCSAVLVQKWNLPQLYSFKTQIYTYITLEKELSILILIFVVSYWKPTVFYPMLHYTWHTCNPSIRFVQKDSEVLPI